MWMKERWGYGGGGLDLVSVDCVSFRVHGRGQSRVLTRVPKHSHSRVEVPDGEE